MKYLPILIIFTCLYNIQTVPTVRVNDFLNAIAYLKSLFVLKKIKETPKDQKTIPPNHKWIPDGKGDPAYWKVDRAILKNHPGSGYEYVAAKQKVELSDDIKNLKPVSLNIYIQMIIVPTEFYTEPIVFPHVLLFIKTENGSYVSFDFAYTLNKMEGLDIRDFWVPKGIEGETTIGLHEKVPEDLVLYQTLPANKNFNIEDALNLAQIIFRVHDYKYSFFGCNCVIFVHNMMQNLCKSYHNSLKNVFLKLVDKVDFPYHENKRKSLKVHYRYIRDYVKSDFSSFTLYNDVVKKEFDEYLKHRTN